MDEPKNVRLSIRIPEWLRRAAVEKAKREDLTVAQMVRRFLREWVAEDDTEDK